MTIQKIAETPYGKNALSLEIQKQPNERWENEFYPLVYNVFQKDIKPDKEGKYVELLTSKEKSEEIAKAILVR